MNPLTLVKRIQSLNSKEAALGISEEASWHAKYEDSAYVYAGGIPFDLTEGDLLAFFSQYRAANTGWGHHEDKNIRWGHDQFEDPKKMEKRSGNMSLDRRPQPTIQEAFRSGDKGSSFRAKGNERALDSHSERSDRREEKISRRHDGNKIKSKLRYHDRGEERKSVRLSDDEFERKSEDRYRREEKRQRRDNDGEVEPRSGEDNYRREEKRLR